MAKKPTRHKARSMAVTVPQSIAQASDYIREIGEHQRDITRIEAAMNDELAGIKERHESQAQPLKQRIESLTKGVQIWCEANREQLTQGGKTKTAALPAGEVAWRTRPPSVRVTGAEAVLDMLRKMGLDRFIRPKTEINKEAILNEPAAVANVPGISIQQGEDFIITPFETELSEVR
ncbi:host-nuclease inhibitor protein Gam [Parazoarcus communis]|uniref:Host-nuclease inhibitor protein Gam n=2 Tax=Parazoarcus communis TaxID=41977 RepID=A0A2U8GZ70_9RHOO|nr:host-nuclease inhibitor protein Gam [Parazoarcus communis]